MSPNSALSKLHRLTVSGYDTSCYRYTTCNGRLSIADEVPLAPMEGHGAASPSRHDHHVAVHNWVYHTHGSEAHVAHCYGSYSSPTDTCRIIADLSFRLLAHWSLPPTLSFLKLSPRVLSPTNTYPARSVKLSLPRLALMTALGSHSFCLLLTSSGIHPKKMSTSSLEWLELPLRVPID